MEIHTIDLEFQGVPGLIASYLIETVEGLIVFEPGPESSRETHLRKIAELGFDAADVGAVFITHAHLDHCGAGGWWAGQGAMLYVHPKAVRHIVDPTRLLESARGVFGARFDALWGEMLPAAEHKVRALEDGERVEIGGVEIEAIDTPGHAFHHHAYALGGEGRGALFSGDVAGMRLADSDFISVTSAPPQFHLESYLASIDRLRVRDFDRLLLTHFGEVADIAGHWALYRKRVAQVAEQVGRLQADGAAEEAIRAAFGEAESDRARAAGVDDAQWDRYQLANGTDMCADGLRMYWERLRSA